MELVLANNRRLCTGEPRGPSRNLCGQVLQFSANKKTFFNFFLNFLFGRTRGTGSGAEISLGLRSRDRDEGRESFHFGRFGEPDHRVGKVFIRIGVRGRIPRARESFLKGCVLTVGM